MIVILSKDGFISIEAIFVTSVIICLGIYSLMSFQVTGEATVDSVAITINQVVATPYNSNNDYIVEDSELENENEEENKIKEWVSSGEKYIIGDIVWYKGKEYICTYEHITNGDLNWAPNIVHSLWKRNN